MNNDRAKWHRCCDWCGGPNHREDSRCCDEECEERQKQSAENA